MGENCHGQGSVEGKVKEAEATCVHNITEELREGRAEPAIEEQGKERVPANWSFSPGDGGEYPRARMRTRLRRPEEVVILPQLLRGELGGGGFPLLSQRREPLRLGRFMPFPLSAFGAMAEVEMALEDLPVPPEPPEAPGPGGS